MAVKTNPLDSVSTKHSASAMKIAKLPNLGDMTRGMGFSAGISEYDRKMEEWRQQLERQLNEQLARV